MALFCVITGTGANSGALIRSKSGQPLTSSTLHWISVSGAQQRMPDDAVEAAKESCVCRFQHAGRLALGSTHDDEDAIVRCRIVYYGNIITKDKFEVLVNTHQAGRLIWSAWDRSRLSFVGAVQVGDHYVARVRTSGLRAGHLDPSVHRGRIFTIVDRDDGETIEQTVDQAQEGEILLEMEPLEYEVTSLQSARNRRKVQSQEDVQLAHTILDNMEGEDGPEFQTVASTLSYVTTHSVYLSHVKAMVKGLASSIQLGDETHGGVVTFQWGDPSISGTFPQVVDVSHRLEPGTGVNVSLTARRVTFDAPFTAKLATTYSDKFVGKRQIDGQARQTVVEDVKLHYSPIYFLSNGSTVPSTTTTTTSTTTTTETPTTTIQTTDEPDPVTKAPSLKQTKVTLEFKSAATCHQHSIVFYLTTGILMFVIR